MATGTLPGLSFTPQTAGNYTITLAVSVAGVPGLTSLTSLALTVAQAPPTVQIGSGLQTVQSGGATADLVALVGGPALADGVSYQWTVVGPNGNVPLTKFEGPPRELLSKLNLL